MFRQFDQLWKVASVIATLALGCGIALSPTLIAAIPQAKSQETDPSSLTIYGIVRSRDTGKPYPRVTVMLTQQNFTIIGLASGTAARQTATDSNGRFSFSKLTPGEYSLRAVSPDRPTGSQETSKKITLRDGTPVPDLALWIDGTAKISGRIITKTGDPVSGAYVALYGRSQDAGGKVHATTVLPAVRSDADGQYAFAIRPGKYYLWARASAGSSVRDVEVASVYYPGVANIDDAVMIEAREGGEAAGINLNLEDTERFRVQFHLPLPEFKNLGAPAGRPPLCFDTVNGRVQRRECRTEEIPLVQASIRPLGRGLITLPEQSLTLESLSNDVYRMPPLGPGDHELVIVHAPQLKTMYPNLDWDRIERIARIRFTVIDRDLNLGTISRAAGTSVSGRVYMEGAAAGIQTPPFSFVSLDFMVIGPMSPTFKAEGTFVIQATLPGVYRFALQGPAPVGLYVESVTSGGRDVLKDGLVVNGDQTGFVNVVMRHGTAKVEGIVRNASGNAVPNAHVILIPPLSRRGLVTRFQTATADGSGAFVIDGIRPGEYRLLAVDLDERRPPSWEAPDFLRTYEGRGELVRLGPLARLETTLVPVSISD